MNPVVFSSNRQDWETPQRLFDALDAEFGFTLDACATPLNAKCVVFISPEGNALRQQWNTTGAVWMNPPYGYQIHKWVQKAFEESQSGATVVALIPAKTETRYWHDYVMRSEEIRLIRGRLRFSGHTVNAPFPSAIVVFRPGVHFPRLTTMDRLLDEVAA